MSHLPDDQLAGHLRRRATSAPFDDETRHQLAMAIHEQVAATPRRGRAFDGPLLRWATAAVAAVVLVALGAVVLSRLDVAPGPAAPSPPATWGVLSADELAEAFTSGDFAGTVVMADARLIDVSVSPCPRLALCTRPVIAGHPEIVVEMESGPNVWPGLRAFRIESDRVIHLGAVELPDKPRAWTVPDMLELVPPVAEGEAATIYPVLGWLSVEAYSCARPRSLPGAPEPLPEAWCRAAWLTDSPFEVNVLAHDGSLAILTPDGPALRVQAEAYARFTGQPDEGGDPRPPTKGLYLVRRAPCPAHMAECSLWEVVGRISTLESDVEASPPPGLATPTPGPPSNATPTSTSEAPTLEPASSTPPPSSGEIPPTIDGEPVHTGAQIPGVIAAAVDDTPILIGGTVRYMIADCFVPEDFPATPLLKPCTDGYVLATTYELSVRLVILREGIGLWGTGPVVLRVHVYDPLAADCPPAYREQCERAVVVDEVVWTASPDRPLSTAEPADIDGEPVYYSLNTPDYADDRPYLLGGVLYRSPMALLANCPPGEPPPGNPLLRVCTPGDAWAMQVGQIVDFPIVVADDLAFAELFEADATRVVLRVHRNDSRAETCPAAYRQHCQWATVVEEVVWSAPFP